MRKFVVAAVAGLAFATMAVVSATADTTTTPTTTAPSSSTWPAIHVTPTVTPNKAGTKAKPQAVHLKVNVGWQTLGAANQPIVTHFNVLFPKGALYNGTKYPKCSASVLSNEGPAGCPKASIMGGGTGVAYADTTLTRPKITVVNGGANTVYFYTVLNNPARVQEPIAGHLTKMSGKWAYALNVTVPANLRIVAGVPIELTSLSVSAGNSAGWLSTTGCAGGKWPFQLTTQYLNSNSGATGSSTYSASVACKAS